MRIHVDDSGRMTIPQSLLDHLGVANGGDIELRVGGDGKAYIERARPTSSLPQDGLDRIRGISTSGMTTDDIMKMTRGEE